MGQFKETESTAVTAENIKRVEDYFEAKPESSHPRSKSRLGSFNHGILRVQLKWKPYKPLRVNMLTEKNREDRMTFCRWFLAQDYDLVQRVIFSDEKWFLLHQGPNSKNDIMWAPTHPEEVEECRRQGDTKLMAWVGVVDGTALKVRWMTDEEDRPVSVTSARYLAMLRDEVWPEVRHRSSHRRYWWQQHHIAPTKFSTWSNPSSTTASFSAVQPSVGHPIHWT